MKENRAALELPKPETEEEKAARADQDTEKETAPERKRRIGGDKKAGEQGDPAKTEETVTDRDTEQEKEEDAAKDADVADQSDKA